MKIEPFNAADLDYFPPDEPWPRPNGPDARAPKPSLIGFNPADWENDPEPEDRKWIVPDYILDDTVTLLSADGGTGKSYLKLQLAAARALAREWIGLLPEPGRTLVLSCEDDIKEMKRRLYGILKFYKSEARPNGAHWADLGNNIRLVDLVGENSILGNLNKGVIEPTPMYHALDAFMAEFKPRLTALDARVALFSGDERIRTQVRQFANLLHALCRKHHSAILLLAHPSVAGINTGTGLSGSTDWNNAFRSRLYFETIKTAEGRDLNKNLCRFQGKKSNYGEIGGAFDVEFKNGLFVPVRGLAGFDKMAADTKTDELFITTVKCRNSQSRTVSDKPGANYAPAVFAKEPEAIALGLSAKQLEAAMERLFKAGKIKVEIIGPPSRRTRSIVLFERL